MEHNFPYALHWHFLAFADPYETHLSSLAQLRPSLAPPINITWSAPADQDKRNVSSEWATIWQWMMSGDENHCLRRINIPGKTVFRYSWGDRSAVCHSKVCLLCLVYVSFIHQMWMCSESSWWKWFLYSAFSCYPTHCKLDMIPVRLHLSTCNHW